MKKVTQEKLLSILNQRKYKYSTNKEITTTFQAIVEKFPETLSYDKFCEIVKETKDTQEIVTAILSASVSRQTRKDADAGQKSEKHKGRPKSKESNTFKEAFAIIENKTLLEWTKLGLSLNDILDLRLQAILKFFNAEPDNHSSKHFSKEAYNKMSKEVGILLAVMFSFLSTLDRAIKENNQTFLNAAKKAFGSDLNEYLPTDIRKKESGRKVRKNALINSLQLLRAWAFNQKDTTLPHTFGAFDKQRGFCVLAHRIHLYLLQPLTLREMNLDLKMLRLRTLEKIHLLIEKHHFTPNEIFPSISILPTLETIEQLEREGATHKKAHWTTQQKNDKTTSGLIKEIIERGMEIDRQLQQFKDI